jgi:protein TonB
MAYLDTKPQQNRAAIIGIVAVIHGLAAYAIVTGLTQKYSREVMTILEAHNIPADLPPPRPLPEPPKAKPMPSDTKIDRPERRIEFSIGDSLKLPFAEDDAGLLPLPQPVPSFAPTTPAFTPQPARPSNDRAGWATTSDYPSRDLREGNQGVTGFKLIVGTTGRVESCLITRSSGFTGLDEAACANVSRRARFKPAIGADGQPTGGEYASSVRWVIPG